MPLDPHVQQLLKQAFSQRQPLRKITNALRLVNAKGDGLAGLVLEQYNRHFVAQFFDSCWLKEAQSLRDFLKGQFPVDYFILKNRTQSSSSRAKDIPTQVLIHAAPAQTVVKENGLSFEVDLNDTLNTGLFLDMRTNRQLVGKHCRGKRVLNSFSYTCSFGVYAKANGAFQVFNVDVSKKILERGKRNYELNKLSLGPGEFVRANAVDFLERAVKKDNRFDVIILDPPSFARVDGKVFSVAKDLKKLVELAILVLNRQGKLLLATNFSGFSHKDLEVLVKGASGKNKISVITRLGQDKDFPGSGQSKESHLAALWIKKE